jgi:hypothetical protein
MFSMINPVLHAFWWEPSQPTRIPPTEGMPYLGGHWLVEGKSSEAPAPPEKSIWKQGKHKSSVDTG